MSASDHLSERQFDFEVISREALPTPQRGRLYHGSSERIEDEFLRPPHETGVEGRYTHSYEEENEWRGKQVWMDPKPGVAREWAEEGFEGELDTYLYEVEPEGKVGDMGYEGLYAPRARIHKRWMMPSELDS